MTVWERARKFGICPKRAYYTREDAEKAALVFGKQFETMFETYSCPHCCLFHLTTKRKENPR